MHVPLKNSTVLSTIVHVPLKNSTILSTMLGGVLFAAGMYSVLDASSFYAEPFFFGVVASRLIMALGITAIAQSFRKAVRVRMWLSIPNLAVAGLALLALIIRLASSPVH